MNGIQSQTFSKKPEFIIGIILAVFFLKGVFLSAIQPIFGGQDEARHYDTVQYHAEPKGAVSPEEKIQKRNNELLRDKDNFDTYNFSEEIQKTANATDTDVLRGEIYNTIRFSRSSEGINEADIIAKTWRPYNYYTEPDIAGTKSLYHKTASQIETFFSGQDILVRFYLIRIFSVLLATLGVYFCYLTAKTIGLSSKISLILTAILAFQPKFSLYSTNINYDAITVPVFFLFTYTGVRTLRDGFNWKTISLLLGSILIATQNKGTGYILIVILAALITYFLYEKVQTKSKNFRYSVYGASLFGIVAISLFLFDHFLGSGQPIGKIIQSLSEYLSKTITFNRFILPSPTYWGTLSWVHSTVLPNVTNIIFVIETASIVGLGLLLFSRKFKESYPAFLPAKKYIVFLIGMIVALQLGVRAADWTVFSNVGAAMSLGTPGRYFLPNLVSHILLFGIGLGALLAFFKKERYFEPLLVTLLIGMFSLMMYLTFNVIILRFYF